MKPKSMKANNRKNNRRLLLWTLLWTASLALASFGHKFFWAGNEMITTTVIALSVVLGLLMIAANRRLIDDFDELDKKIHLESMSLTLGLTLVMGIAYNMMSITHLITAEAKISILVIFMSLCYLTTLLINRFRYR